MCGTQYLNHNIDTIKPTGSLHSGAGGLRVGEELKVSRHASPGRAGARRPRLGLPSRGGGGCRGRSEPRERQKHVGRGGWEDADAGVTGGSVKEEGVEGC